MARAAIGRWARVIYSFDKDVRTAYIALVHAYELIYCDRLMLYWEIRIENVNILAVYVFAFEKKAITFISGKQTVTRNVGVAPLRHP